MTTILITGGARSGKSRFALELAHRSDPPVLFVATATAGDEEMGQRIKEHREQRPRSWRTLEATTQVGSEIQKNIAGSRTVIVDCISLLVNNIFSKYTDQFGELTEIPKLEKAVDDEINGLAACPSQMEAGFIIVTNEVSFGLVPVNRMGRIYRDILGKANQILATRADEVYLMVAGIPVKIKPAATG